MKGVTLWSQRLKDVVAATGTAVVGVTTVVLTRQPEGLRPPRHSASVSKRRTGCFNGSTYSAGYDETWSRLLLLGGGAGHVLQGFPPLATDLCPRLREA